MDPRQRNLLSMAFVLVLVALAWWKFWPPSEKITQGLDIQGGLSVILTAKGTPENPVTNEAMDRAELIVRNRVDKLGASEVTIQRQGSDSILVQLPGIANAQEALDALGSTGQLEIREVTGTDPATGEVTVGDVLLTGDVITSATIGTNPENNEIEVDVEFDSKGSAAWAEITGTHVGQQIAIVLDGKVESSPVVRERITGGRTAISGSFTPEEARRLKTVLETGALPVTLEFNESRVVGPTLGQDAMRQGLYAGLAGLLCVGLYLVAFYRGFGLASWFALSLAASMFLGALSLLSMFGWFALTLPGIAGIVLTIGLTADSEILMIERFKEEVANGKTYRSAARHGTVHAIGTSIDADLVTFVSALMLYIFAIGPVRGFALTLMIGLSIDIVTMVFWSRSVVVTLAETLVPKMPRFFGMRGGEADA